MTRRDVAHASLPVFAFAIPFAGYATGVLVEPSFGTLLPAPVLAGGLLASAAAVGHERGFALAVTASFCAFPSSYAHLTFVDGWGEGVLGRIAVFGRLDALLVVFLLGFVVGTVGYLGGGALYWSHARLGDTLNAPDP